MSSAPASPARRRGPRTGGSDTRAEIVDSARAEFADRGYNGATVRSIGSRAGVDAAMINHYFGGKAGLFQEVIHIPFDPAEGLGAVLAGSREDRGRRLARFMLGVWERRHVLGLPPLAGPSLDELACDVGPVIQRHLDGT